MKNVMVLLAVLASLASLSSGNAQFYGSYGRRDLIRPQSFAAFPYSFEQVEPRFNLPLQAPQLQSSQSAPNLLTRVSAEALQNIRMAITDISHGSESFSLDMFRAIATALRAHDANFVIAPFSVWSLMVLVAEGADGQSFAQLDRALHLPNDLTTLRIAYKNFQRQLLVNTSTVELAVNQALFSDINQPINNAYARVLQQEYEADHLPVDYRDSVNAAKKINDHIALRTQGKVKDVLKPDDLNEAQLLLTSTIFFKGQWKFPFNTSMTKDLPFHREDGSLVGNVPMMYQRNVFPQATIIALDASVLELPYGKEDRLCMLLLLPRRNSTLTAVFDNLKNFNIAQIDHELHKFDGTDDYDDSEIELTLPKFNIDSDLELRTVFEYLGISDIFNPTTANLSKMSNQRTHVSRVFHKAIIEVNEVGTVAAAATIGTVSFKQTPVEFVFNRPFGFLITDKKTSTLLFAGQVRQPLV